MHFLGLDIGSSGCKAVVFDEHGSVVASAQREYETLFPEEGAAELDSDHVIGRCLEVVRAASEAAGAGHVAGIGVSSQGEAFTAVDGEGGVLNRALISSDSRPAPVMQRWIETLGADRLYRITGHTAHPMFTLFKLLWLRERQPDVWRKAARFLCFEDLLALRLGVEPAMGWPLAGRTMLFDVQRHVWSPEILDAIGLKAGRLARPLASGAVSGVIAAGTARWLGLAQGAVLVTGGHDQPCGALGAGAVTPGCAMYGTGTVECITPTFEAPVFSDGLRRGNLCTYDHVLAGAYTTVAFSLTGGNILKWYRDVLGGEAVRRAAETGTSPYALILEECPGEPTSLLVLPYFTPSGTPHFDMRTPGAILGLRLTTGRGEFVRALLEGVALEMRLNLTLLEQAGCPVRELRAIGGGARSPKWVQLKADVLGKPVTVLNVTEAGCLGGAMLACAAVTGGDVRDLARTWVRAVGTVAPRPAQAATYAARFERYRALYPVLRDFGKTGDPCSS